MGELDGKRIIVTGGARGIGEAAVDAFSHAGASVVSLDIGHSDGDAGSGILRLRCDIASAASVETAFGGAVAHLGGLDALANVAGVISQHPAESIPLAEWGRVIGVNATGTLLTNQAAFPHLRAAGGGSIINIGSVAGVRGYPNGAHYAASKGAVLAWTRTVADEWGPLGIRVNAVAPSVWTPMYDEWRAGLTPAELAAHDEFQRISTPIGGKLGDPRGDLAPLLVFLAGDGSRFITGQTIAADGGKLKPS
jgi:NAD(P)-dependent dehydrogenase (short-subunit alcohol dehydrogenase family)